jgi:hypothetical protein
MPFDFPDPLPLGLPASLRFARHRPFWLRARGCLLPPGLGTCGILPALLSAISGIPSGGETLSPQQHD